MERYKSFITNSLSNNTYISEEQFFDKLIQSLENTSAGGNLKTNKSFVVKAASDRLKFFLTENRDVAT